MSHTLSNAVLSLIFGVVFILLILGLLVAWTTSLAFRLRKIAPPKRRWIFCIAYLQMLLGTGTVFLLKKTGPAPALGSGMFILILTGLFSMKWILRYDWKQALPLWGIAGGLQLVILPVIAFIMSLALIMMLTIIFPPQY